MTYEEAVNYLNETARFAKKNEPEHIKYLLERLGSPQRNLRCVHVAGTNGKGSVCAFIEAFLQEKGWTTGVFSSPHLVSVNERIRLNGRDISDDAFADACGKVKKIVKEDMAEGGNHPSFFECLFLMAMLVFHREMPDCCIIETGMGGRYDATNVLEPEISVITSISMDHMEFLGNTIEDIAAHKAGIIKPGKRVLCAEQRPEVMEVVRREASGKHAFLETVSEDNLKFNEKLGKYIDFLNSNAYDRKRVAGEFQKENMALAIRAVQLLSGTLSDEMIRRGLGHIVLPGRMEEVLPDVFVDAAHNIQGIEAFCRTAEKQFAGKKKRILFAASHKNEENSMRTVLSGLPLTEMFLELSVQNRTVNEQEFESAFEQLIKDRDENTVCFVVGSFYLAGITKKCVIRRKQDVRL